MSDNQPSPELVTCRSDLVYIDRKLRKAQTRKESTSNDLQPLRTSIQLPLQGDFQHPGLVYGPNDPLYHRHLQSPYRDSSHIVQDETDEDEDISNEQEKRERSLSEQKQAKVDLQEYGASRRNTNVHYSVYPSTNLERKQITGYQDIDKYEGNQIELPLGRCINPSPASKAPILVRLARVGSVAELQTQQHQKYEILLQRTRDPFWPEPDVQRAASVRRKLRFENLRAAAKSLAGSIFEKGNNVTAQLDDAQRLARTRVNVGVTQDEATKEGVEIGEQAVVPLRKVQCLRDVPTGSSLRVAQSEITDNILRSLSSTTSTGRANEDSSSNSSNGGRSHPARAICKASQC